MKDKIEIPLSKNKLFFGVGGSILFVILGAQLFLNAHEFQNHSMRLLRNPMVVKGIGMLSILFFGATGLYGIRKLFDKKVGLLIDENGITDHSNASSIGLIKWKDISAIETKQVMSTKFLLIVVDNPEEYIEKAGSKMKQKLLRTNYKMYGTPLSVTSNTLKFNFSKLEELVQAEFARYKD